MTKWCHHNFTILAQMSQLCVLDLPYTAVAVVCYSCSAPPKFHFLFFVGLNDWACIVSSFRSIVRRRETSSLGVVFYSLVHHSFPLESESSHSILYQINQKIHPPSFIKQTFSHNFQRNDTLFPVILTKRTLTAHPHRISGTLHLYPSQSVDYVVIVSYSENVQDFLADILATLLSIMIKCSCVCDCVWLCVANEKTENVKKPRASMLPVYFTFNKVHSVVVSVSHQSLQFHAIRINMFIPCHNPLSIPTYEVYFKVFCHS